MQDDVRSAVADGANAGGESDPANTAEAGEAREGGGVAAERDQLAREKAEWQDRALRLQADFENYRRRAERDRLEFTEYAGMEVMRSLLTVIDDLERALKAAADTGSGDSEFARGVELIYNRMMDTLHKQGLEPIEAANAKFDPHVHHAVQKEQTEDVEDETILEVYQRGYKFKGKLLRPAMVKVAVRP
jgi:molecular chaperone GrpE